MTIALERPPGRPGEAPTDLVGGNQTRSLTQRAPQLQAPPSRAHPGPILSLIFLGAVMVLSLWWVNADTKPNLGDWLTEVGRITGLLAG